MTADPQNADGPDTPQDMAWEAWHCARRLESLAEDVSRHSVNAAYEFRTAARAIRLGLERLEVTGWSP